LNNQSYAYAMGRVRAVERGMLGRQQLDRMIDAKSMDEALRVLREAGYASSGAGAEGALGAADVGAGGAADTGGGDGGGEGYEWMLDAESDKIIAFFREVSPEQALLGIFLRQNDYHNAKVFLKAEFSKTPPEAELPLSRSGLIEPQALRVSIRERAFSDLPREFAHGVADAIVAYGKANDPQMIDIVLDRACFSQMLHEAEALGNAFLTGFVRARIDLSNIGAFVRIRAMKKSWEFLRDALAQGGTLDAAFFNRYLPDSIDNFLAATQYSPYGAVCDEGLRAFVATGSLTLFERLCDNWLIEYVKKAKLMPMGVEILAAYLYARQSEIKNVRIVLTGKRNNVSGEVIRERLRETYV